MIEKNSKCNVCDGVIEDDTSAHFEVCDSCRVPFAFDEMTIIVPDSFWPALGYDGEARYVSIHWERDGSQVCYSDGRESYCGASWQAYNLLMSQLPESHRWKTGSSDDFDTHWLVVDRKYGRVWIVPHVSAVMFLSDQWPTIKVADFERIEVENWDQFVENLTSWIDHFKRLVIEPTKFDGHPIVDPEAFKTFKNDLSEKLTLLRSMDERSSSREN